MIDIHKYPMDEESRITVTLFCIINCVFAKQHFLNSNIMVVSS
jgi:hypothetical protein